MLVDSIHWVVLLVIQVSSDRNSIIECEPWFPERPSFWGNISPICFSSLCYSLPNVDMIKDNAPLFVFAREEIHGIHEARSSCIKQVALRCRIHGCRPAVCKD